MRSRRRCVAAMTVALAATSCAAIAGIDAPIARDDAGVPLDGAPADAPNEASRDASGEACAADVCRDDAAVTDGAKADAPIEAGCDGGTPPTKNAMYLSDPLPTIAATANGYVLHKELNAYANYGAADGSADILYDNMSVGAWTFAIPAGNVVSATVVLSMVLDDTSTFPTSAYAYKLWSSACEYDSAGQLPHGTPPNTRFNDWVEITEPASVTPGAVYTVTVLDTSQTGNTGFIAVDWIEIHVVTQ